MANSNLFKEIKERLRIEIPEDQEKAFFKRAYANKINKILLKSW